MASYTQPRHLFFFHETWTKGFFADEQSWRLEECRHIPCCDAFFLFRHLLLATEGRNLGLMGFWSDLAQPFLCSSIPSENVLSTVWTDLSWASFVRRNRIQKYLIKLCSKNISNFSPLLLLHEPCAYSKCEILNHSAAQQCVQHTGC